VSGGFTGHGRSSVYTADELLSVDRYREYVFRALPRPEPMELRTSDSVGLVLADDVMSPEALPAFANSAMDGYAVRSEEVAGATEEAPVILSVTGEVVAGAAGVGQVEPGTAVRIMTGAPLPPGADAVVPVEVTTESGSRVTVVRPSARGEYVRPVGQDVVAGARLLPAGRRVSPADLALLIAAGVGRLRCFPAPRVAILSTGDELVHVDVEPRPGQIRDSNGPMLAALVRQAGGVPYLAGPVRDERGAMIEALESNLGHADLVLLTGGVSAGTRDLVAAVIGHLGEAAKFKVAMQPGMPQVVGKIGDVPVLGLPGNPVSAFVSFEIFVRPAMRVLQGRSDLLRPTVTAVMAGDVVSPAHKRSFLRVRLSRRDGRWVASPTGPQGSHMLTSISVADGLAEVPEDVTSLSAGDPVTVHLLVDA
jgi:molybdopterin molybdotransferase